MPDLEGNRPIIPILTGPTASGKTSIVNRLFELYPDLHVISADSRQIYKYMDIGTDKPSKAEMAKYNYHLVDFVEPGERYTAFNFVADANRILADLIGKGRIPLICGGTGLYIKSLVDGIVEIPEDDLLIRQKLVDEASQLGPKYLYNKLMDIDPDEALKIHPNNIRKIIRALEIYYLTGKPKSKIIADGNNDVDKYNFHIYCLMPARNKLYATIETRIDKMIQDGLLSEATALGKMGIKEKITAINVIGYNELFEYMDNEISLDTAINLIKQNSRRFAKRQITWFKGMNKVVIFQSADELFDHLLRYWAEKK